MSDRTWLDDIGELGRYRVIIGESGVLEGWKLPEVNGG